MEIISTLVAVGRGGDYLDTGSGSSSSSSVSREISYSESVLWTTNCPLVLACSGLEDGGHFPWSLYTFRIQSVFLLFIKYTHDYPQCVQGMQAILIYNNLLGYMSEGADMNIHLPRSHVSKLLRLPNPFLLSPLYAARISSSQPLRSTSSHFPDQYNPHT